MVEPGGLLGVMADLREGKSIDLTDLDFTGIFVRHGYKQAEAKDRNSVDERWHRIVAGFVQDETK